MNAPLTKATHGSFTGLLDCNQSEIRVGDLVRKYDTSGMEIGREFIVGTVVFTRGSYRILPSSNYNGTEYPKLCAKSSLQYNGSLVYNETFRTQHIEVITGEKR